MAKKPIKPVDLAIPNYYERSPKDLFENELAFSDRNFRIAKFFAKRVTNEISFHDPQGIMAEFGNVPVVRVLNHDDLSNPLLLGLAAEQHGFAVARSAAMAELFKNPRMARFIGSLGGFPIDRARFVSMDKKVIRHFLKMGAYILEELVQPIDIFPEGQISESSIAGIIGETGTGATNIAKRSEVPVIIMGQFGGRNAGPKALVPFHDTDVTIVVHDVIMPEEKINAMQLRANMQSALNAARVMHQA